jgi:hypothetical protein
LIEQGLEEVMVAAIDERDPNRRTGKRAGGVDTTETTPDDNYVGSAIRELHGLDMMVRAEIVNGL